MQPTFSSFPFAGDFESDFSLEDNDACFKTKIANLWCNENIRQSSTHI